MATRLLQFRGLILHVSVVNVARRPSTLYFDTVLLLQSIIGSSKPNKNCDGCTVIKIAGA